MEEQPPYLTSKPKREKLIPVRMTKAILYLTESELVRLLSLNPELWQRAIRRGKRIKLERAAKRRQIKCGIKR